MKNDGLSATDLVPKIATDTFFSTVTEVSVNGVSAIPFSELDNINLELSAYNNSYLTYAEAEQYMPLALSAATLALSGESNVIKVNVAISCDYSLTCNNETDDHYFYVATPTVSVAISETDLTAASRAVLSALRSRAAATSVLAAWRSDLT
jgi:hypothetical protein